MLLAIITWAAVTVTTMAAIAIAQHVHPERFTPAAVAHRYARTH